MRFTGWWRILMRFRAISIGDSCRLRRFIAAPPQPVTRPARRDVVVARMPLGSSRLAFRLLSGSSLAAGRRVSRPRLGATWPATEWLILGKNATRSMIDVGLAISGHRAKSYSARSAAF